MAKKLGCIKPLSLKILECEKSLSPLPLNLEAWMVPHGLAKKLECIKPLSLSFLECKKSLSPLPLNLEAWMVPHGLAKNSTVRAFYGAGHLGCGHHPNSYESYPPS